MTSQIKTTAPQLNTTLFGGEPQSKVRRTRPWWAIYQAFIKLDPRQQIRNPVMLLVELGALLTTILFIRVLLLGGSNEPPVFVGVAIACWLWLTVLSASFAETRSEDSGRFRAEAMGQRCRNVTAKKLNRAACKENYNLIPAADLCKGDLILVETGETVPADGEIVEGTALVDERLLYGEQTPILREVGGDWTAIAGGTQVLSDWLVVRLSANPDESLLSHLVGLLETAKYREFTHMTFLKMLYAGSITGVLLFANTIWFSSVGQGTAPWSSINITILVALLLALMPISSSELWRLVNLAEVDQLIRANVIPVSNRAVEMAENIDLLLLDQCQVMTAGSLVEAKVDPVIRPTSLVSPVNEVPADQPTVILPEKRIGSDEKNRVDQDLKKRLAQLRRMGVKTVLTTTDSPHTAAALAAEAGVDDFLAQATPAAKLELILDFKASGYRVAVAGSSSDEAAIMRQADLAIAMNASAHPARETAGMIDLTGNPARMVKIAEITGQWLTTRRAVTFFSLASDTAKYFVLIPVVFASIFPALEMFNIIGLTTPTTAILATIVFDAVSIVILTHLAGRGMPGWAWVTASSLNNSSLIYIFIGLVVPFIGIKVIDLVLTGLGFVS
jgi:high-affinity K+ transport system ATPase subunit B